MAEESANLLCFMDSFGMQLSRGLKDISSADARLCSFLHFLHLLADGSSGIV